MNTNNLRTQVIHTKPSSTSFYH